MGQQLLPKLGFILSCGELRSWMSVNSLETLQISNRDQGIILLSLPTSLLADPSQQVRFLKTQTPQLRTLHHLWACYAVWRLIWL